MLGFVCEHPEVHVIPAVLGGYSMDPRKTLEIFCEQAASFGILALAFKIMCLRIQFTTRHTPCTAFTG